jgi:ABC-2 type transport system permease protein
LAGVAPGPLDWSNWIRRKELEKLMKKTLMVMGHELRATLARKAFVAISLGLPLLVGAVVLAIILIRQDTGSPSPASVGAGMADTPEAVGYVDAGQLIQAIPSDVPSGWLVPYPDAASAQAALEGGKIGAYYIISADYLESGDLTYVQRGYQLLSDTKPDHGRMEWVLLVNLFGGDGAEAAGAWRPLEVDWQQLPSPQASEGGGAGDSWMAELLPNLLAFLLYMAILIPASTLVSTVTDEKKNRVMEILLSSLSSGQLIGGKILALGLLGLLQTSLWVGILWSVARLGGQALNLPPGFAIPPLLLLWCFVYSLLGYAMYGSQMAGLGALAPDVKDTSAPTMVVLAPLILVYMFLVVIVQRPDSALSVALSLFPLTSPVAMMARMTATHVPVWQSVLAAALQLLTSILIVRAVARLFRAQTLLSGQPFSLRAYGNALIGRDRQKAIQ